MSLHKVRLYPLSLPLKNIQDNFAKVELMDLATQKLTHICKSFVFDPQMLAALAEIIQ